MTPIIFESRVASQGRTPVGQEPSQPIAIIRSALQLLTVLALLASSCSSSNDSQSSLTNQTDEVAPTAGLTTRGTDAGTASTIEAATTTTARVTNTSEDRSSGTERELSNDFLSTGWEETTAFASEAFTVDVDGDALVLSTSSGYIDPETGDLYAELSNESGSAESYSLGAILVARQEAEPWRAFDREELTAGFSSAASDSELLTRHQPFVTSREPPGDDLVGTHALEMLVPEESATGALSPDLADIPATRWTRWWDRDGRLVAEETASWRIHDGEFAPLFVQTIFYAGPSGLLGIGEFVVAGDDQGLEEALLAAWRSHSVLRNTEDADSADPSSGDEEALGLSDGGVTVRTAARTVRQIIPPPISPPFGGSDVPAPGAQLAAVMAVSFGSAYVSSPRLIAGGPAGQYAAQAAWATSLVPSLESLAAAITGVLLGAGAAILTTARPKGAPGDGATITIPRRLPDTAPPPPPRLPSPRDVLCRLLQGIADLGDSVEGGVYHLLDLEGTVRYVGETKSFARRAAEHARDPRLRDLDFDRVFRTNNRNVRRGLEQLEYEHIWGDVSIDDAKRDGSLNRKRPMRKINPLYKIRTSMARKFVELCR